MHRLTLIGMPGSGKSAVGNIIASRLNWNFIDTDKCIESRVGMPLQTLIDQVGDKSFRRLEEETVLDLAVTERTVISTGGSVVYSDAAMRHLASISTVVFLDAGIETIRAHIRSEAPRGIVGMTEEGLEGLYRERLPRYLQYAGIVVTCDVETPEEVATKVLSQALGALSQEPIACRQR
jgi:shikimate kinase